MIEMLGVLAIIGVLSVGGIAGYSKAMMKFKINKTIDQIAMTVTNIRTLYAQQNTYAGLATSKAPKMGITDDAMGTSVPLKNPFGGAVLIGTDKSGAVGEPKVSDKEQGAFTITYYGLPREACVAIATNDWGSNYSAGFLGIKTDKGAAPAAASGSSDPTTPTLACYIGGGTVADTSFADKANGAKGVACAAHGIPLSVSQAAQGCACTGTDANTCLITLKYY